MRNLILLSLIILVSSSCSLSESKKLFEIKGQTMGTTYSVKFYGPRKLNLPLVKSKISSRLKTVNQQMSTYIPDSEISLFNKDQSLREHQISHWFGKTLETSLELAEKTKGAFDPTIGPLVNLWGFGPDKHKNPPSDEAITKAQNKVGFKKITLKKGSQQKWLLSKTQKDIYLDLSASAKGFGVDSVSQLLSELGHHNHLVEIGGELKAQGQKDKAPWRVAIEKPQNESRKAQEVIPLKNLALATSGNYRNFFKSGGKVYPHTINQRTGRPAQSNLLSASVIHPSCTTADALATAFMVMGSEKALKFAEKENISALFIIVEKSDTSPKVRVIKSSTYLEMRKKQ